MTFDKKAYSKKYHIKNRAKIAEYNNAYYIKNYEKLKLYRKEYFTKNRERSLRQSKEHYQKTKSIVYDKYGNICVCCGESNLFFLNIDHVNDDGYKEKYKGGARFSGTSFHIKIIRENFPPKYQLLCANCNQGKKLNGGVCPHKTKKIYEAI